jgi:hypothetical protein
MASFGLRVFDENGGLSMDTNTFTYQVIWQGVIDFSGATPSYTLNIPGFNPANCVFMIIPGHRMCNRLNSTGAEIKSPIPMSPLRWVRLLS